LATVFASNGAIAQVGARLTLDESGVFSTAGLSGSAFETLAQAAERVLAEQRSPTRCLSSHGFDALLEVIEPPPHLLVIGTGADALPLVEFAAALGFGVTVCGTSAGVAVRERFAGRAELHVGEIASIAPLIAARLRPVAVVMSHHYPTDRQALAMLLDSRAAYIGVLGPLRRSQRMFDELFPDPVALAKRDPARVRAPLGLDLGAETPAQIALSAIAEIQAVLARASALPLSLRGDRAIHDQVSELAPSAGRPLAKTGTA
jgi:xanthine/CO dehydrogenase XdhC/CoxF family maturation factor